MPTVNERLQHAATDHAIDLVHFGNAVVQKIIALLNRADADLFAQITAALERLPPESFTVQRLDDLLNNVRFVNAQAYQAIDRELTPELQKLASYEAGYQYSLFTATIPPQVVAQVGVAQISGHQVAAAALARPFQGVLLKEALSELADGRAKAIRDQIRIGYVAQEPVDKIVQRLRGTRAKGYADGFFEAPRRHVESVVRTAVSHTAAVARDNFFEANKSLIKAVSWLSTLDTRTTFACQVRDGLRYTPDTHKPIGHSVPWCLAGGGCGPGQLHWNCRSTSVPITKSWKELTGVDLPEMSPGARASMDGQVPADQTYGQWLTNQSAARQDQILGPVRGKLLRDGGITVDQFSNSKGVLLSLDELKAKDAAAFEKAGV